MDEKLPDGGHTFATRISEFLVHVLLPILNPVSETKHTLTFTFGVVFRLLTASPSIAMFC